MELCEILKLLRMERNLTQADVASVLSITPEAYTQYEKGRRQPNLENLTRLSKFFMVTTDYLLGISDYRNFDEYSITLPLSPKLSTDEEQLLNTYRKLSSDLKAEIRGEIKGILRTTQEQQSATNDNASTKKVI
ncbi:helix-turn-helix domain-containing protein [Ruminiclostridium cellobioparum]|uniref:helix-turn-helix domain-containing protein n=1 Tax=Ruminiclostridium cellobioparum TaxID=29355 RepID=UPI0004809B00|nr:helix-turn-helix transcriptional regulator [Ruminiclostridium cellobioparum]